MYQTFYGFQRPPFSIFPDHTLLFLNQQYQLALSLLEFGVLNPNGIVIFTGDTGTGKTTLIQRILSILDETVVVGLLTFIPGKGSSIVPWVIKAFGLECHSHEPADMFQTIVDFLAQTHGDKQRAVLIVDEAQNLDVEQLEELRLLYNLNDSDHSLFQLVVAGHSQLRQLLQQPALAAFVQRIGTDFSLRNFSQQDTKLYILHRIQAAGGSATLFSEKACDVVYDYTKGNPRLINQLCETSLVYGFSDQVESITEHYVDQAAQDRMKGGLLPLSPEFQTNGPPEETGEPGWQAQEPQAFR